MRKRLIGTGRGVASLMAALLVAIPACGDGEESVDITLREFSVGSSTSEVGSGSITFDATNDGPEDEHELVVIRLTDDVDVASLPTSEDGSVDEGGEGIEVIGEIEEFPVGETRSATFELEAGNYALICNIVQEEEGGLEAHYTEGMRAPFTVT